MNDRIFIKGAREHNLKNVDVELPRNKLVVLTGLSGSGKSSLAFDTLYAEGQRRYVESLSSYARQFLGQMEKPDVDYIEGLSPAISIDQKTTSKNPRSTVGTVTEIHDYLRLLYARIGIPHCPKCGREIRQQTVDQMVDQVLALPERTRIQVLAPVIRGRKGEHVKVLEDLKRDGYVRVRIDGEMRELDEEIHLEKNKKHTIEAVVDRLVVREGMNKRLTDSLETAMKVSGGLIVLDVIDGEEMLFSQNYACPDCGISLEELTPRMFSFNNPYGACPTCSGLGTLMRMDPELILPNRDLSLNEGALRVTGWNSGADGSIFNMYLAAMAERYGFSLDVPVKDLPREALDALLYGTKGEKLSLHYERDGRTTTYSAPFEGVIPSLERRYRETNSPGMREEYEAYMSNIPCPDCRGQRLKPVSLAVTVGGLNIAALSDLSVRKARSFLSQLTLTEKEERIARQILKEIDNRLGFLCDVGLEYLTLSRSAGTLSGGEAQRIRLATQIGSSLMGVLYILDEPTTGLHMADVERLIEMLQKLTDAGNSVLVIEHNLDVIKTADHIIDLGPEGGDGGGTIVAQGTPEEVARVPESYTGQWLQKVLP